MTKTATTAGGFTDPVDQVLSGRLVEVPDPPSNTVQIYVASTGADFEQEREQLWNAVLPDLQNHMVTLGLDVQFVDYHHEAHLDHAYDTALFQQHLQQISHAHKNSMGPFFLCMVGNKHGLVPLPVEIEEEEYAYVKEESTKAELALVESWYKQTEGSPVYKLQCLDEHYSSARVRGNLSHEDRADWLTTYDKLITILQRASKKSSSQGRISQELVHKQQRFFMSTVEHEIQEALQRSIKTCLVIDRRFTEIDHKASCASRYLDMKPCGTINAEAQKRLLTLKDIIKSKLIEDNKVQFHIPWKDKGLDPDICNSHSSYLQKFHSIIVSKIIEMVENYLIKNREIPRSIVSSPDKRELQREIQAHLVLYQQLKRVKIHGFEEVEEHIRTCFNKGHKENHQGILIHGTDGSGKRTLATRSVSLAQEVFGKDCLVIIRYIGSTSRCRTMHDLLLGLCAQLHHILKMKGNLKSSDTVQLLSQFHGALNNLSRSSFRNTVIIIDGLHKLKPQAGSHKFDLQWLATELQPKVHIVMTISDTPPYVHQFNALRDNFQQFDSVVQIPTLQPKVVKGIMRDYCCQVNLMITTEKQKNLLEICKNSSVPLQVQLISELISKEGSLFRNVKHEESSFVYWIQMMFDILEQRYNPQLVIQVCRYLSASHFGLSEIELLDILSCNNEIILAVNHSITNDAGGTQLRFPVWLLHALLNDMLPFLDRRYINDKWLLTWAHKIVGKQAIQRYKPSFEEIKQTHRDIADLFVEKWVGNKPFFVPDRGINIIDTGCRFVSPQPLLYSDTKYNLRRLAETWFQLLHTGDITAFKENTLCSFDYLLATLDSSTLTQLQYQLDMTVEHVLDVDLHLIQRCVSLSKKILCKDPTQLATELIGRLRQIKEHSVQLDNLVQQCMEWCDAHTQPIIVPLSSWHPDPRSECVSTFKLESRIAAMCPTPNNQHVFCSVHGTNQIYMYHVASLRLIATLKGLKDTVTCMAVSGDSKYLFSGSKDRSLYVWKISDGSLHHIFREHEGSIVCMAQLHQNNELLTGCEDSCVRHINGDTRRVRHTTKAHQSSVTCLALSKGHAMLVTGSADKSMKVWAVEDMSLINTIDEGITSPICSMALTSDNTFLITGCEDGSVLVKAFTTGTDGHKLDSHSGNVNKFQATTIIASRDSHHCLISSTDGKLYTYNFRTRKVLHSYGSNTEQHEAITSCHVTNYENLIFSSAGNNVSVWTFLKETTSCLKNDNHSDIVTCIATSRDGKMGISGSRDSLVKLWNLEISDLVATWQGHDAQVTCVDIAENEAFAVTGSEDTTVKVWSIIMGCVITDYKNHRSTVWHVVAMVQSLDSFHVLSAEEDGNVHVWQAEDGVALLTCDTNVTLLATSPSNKYVVSGPSGLDLQLWRVEDGTLVGGEIHHVGVITCVSFSDNSDYIVTGSADCSLKIWETSTGKLTQVLVEHTETVTCGVVSASNTHVVSGSLDHRALIWGFESGAVEHQLIGHTDRVTCLVVTKDSSTVISGSRDGTLRVWSLRLGLPITVYDTHNPIHHINMMPTANRIMLQLERSCHVPILCLHNSPAELLPQAQVPRIAHPVLCSLDGGHVNQDGDSADPDENIGSGRIVFEHKQTVGLSPARVNWKHKAPLLPLKPKPIVAQRPNRMFVSKKSSKQSVSSIPEIIRLSPMKAPIQKTIKAQEIHKEKRSLVRSDFSSHGSSQRSKVKDVKKTSKSNICCIL